MEKFVKSLRETFHSKSGMFLNKQTSYAIVEWAIKTFKPKLEWCYDEPEKPGTYLVETKTPMGRQLTTRAYFNGKAWTFNNQVFWRYLKE